MKDWLNSLRVVGRRLPGSHAQAGRGLPAPDFDRRSSPRRVAWSALAGVAVLAAVVLASPSLMPSAALAATSATTLVSGLSSPKGLAVDASGTLYISDTSAIKQFSGGVLTTLVSAGLSGPRGIAVSKDGVIFVADTGNNALK